MPASRPPPGSGQAELWSTPPNAAAPAAAAVRPAPHPSSPAAASTPRPSTAAAASPALWACLALPQLALETAFRDSDDVAPRALVDGPANRPLVRQADARAAAAGVRPGLVLAGARALLPELAVRRHDPAQVEAALQRLAAKAYGFSSQVALAPPDAVLLEVGASLRLFGGWPRIERGLREQLDALGHAHRIAAAPTPAGAQLLARIEDGMALQNPAQLEQALARIALDDCGLPARLAERLGAMGLRHLRELFRLPRPELARRSGPELLAWLDRLRGAMPDPRPHYLPPERFAARIDFDFGIETVQGLLFPLRRLCTELAAFLLARDGGVQRFELVFRHEDRPETRLPVGLRRAAREAADLFEFARGRLERAALPAACIGFGLLAEELPPFAPERRDLFDPAPRGQLDFEGLVERLRARLGDTAVRGLALYPDHRPECAFRVAEPGAADTLRPDLPPRPLWLLPQPQPLRAGVRRLLAPLERIETGWWDGFDVRRDYAIAELDTGQVAWLFRPAGSEDGWMVHGWFG